MWSVLVFVSMIVLMVVAVMVVVDSVRDIILENGSYRMNLFYVGINTVIVIMWTITLAKAAMS